MLSLRRTLLVLGLLALAVATPAGARSRSHQHRHRPKPAPIVAPGVSTYPASTISGSAASLTGKLLPRGKRPVWFWFQYGPTAAYGRSSTRIRAQWTRYALYVRAHVTGLQPLSTYHFRLVASDCSGCTRGTARGSDRTVTLGGYTNPVYPSDAADPFVLDQDGQEQNYWGYSTGNKFPILHSSDLVHWTRVGSAFTSLPGWVVQKGDWHPWGPSVAQVVESCPGTTSVGCYVMYYTGLSAQTNANCVGVAYSPTPNGPFTDTGPLSNGVTDAQGRPIGCGDSNGYGMIDPSPFVDPSTGRAYLYASEDFACPPASISCSSSNATLQPTISVIPLTPDMLHAAGGRVPLFSGSPGTWEAAGVSAPTVEGPSAIAHKGLYYLFYSGGSYKTTYAMGYATAASPLGPFAKSAGNPLMSGTSTVYSPGGGDQVVTGPAGALWMVYHGRDASYADPRTLRLDPFSWSTTGTGTPDRPVIGGPSSTLQPLQP